MEQSTNNDYAHYTKISAFNEDGIPRVSVDGQAHGTLTLAVCVAGIVIAVILIIIIIVAMECGKVERFILHPQKNQQDLSASQPETNQTKGEHSTKVAIGNKHTDMRATFCILSLCGRKRSSFDVEKAARLSTINEKHRQNSISTIMTDISWNTAGPSQLGDSRETVFATGVPA